MTLHEIENLPEEFLSVETVSEYLGCNPQSLRSAIRDTKTGIPAVVIGNRIKIPRLAFIDAMTTYRRG